MSAPSPGPPDPDPSRDDLWRLYTHAVEEYRFQVSLNWQRLQYFMGLNVAVLSVGAGLLRRRPTTGSPATTWCGSPAS